MNDWKKYKETAKENGISYQTYWTRIKDLGWTPGEAATKPTQKERSDKKWLDLAKENGISRTTYTSRVSRYGWEPSKAATTKTNKRRDLGWIKIAERNGIGRETYLHRVDELFWDPKKASNTKPMTQEEVQKNATKYNKEYWKTKQEQTYNDKNNLYIITPQHIEIALSNGVDKGTVETRVYTLGWTVQEAIHKPLQHNFPDKPKEYEKYRKIAIANGVNRSTFLGRIKLGWALKDAVLKNPTYKHRRTDKKWIDLAVENGINFNTYRSRVDRMHWPKEKAATIPALAKGNYLNEERREAAIEGRKVFQEHLMEGD